MVFPQLGFIICPSFLIWPTPMTSSLKGLSLLWAVYLEPFTLGASLAFEACVIGPVYVPCVTFSDAK